MFERFDAEVLAAALSDDPDDAELTSAAVTAVKRGALIREAMAQILAMVQGHQPAESEWGEWLDAFEAEALAAFALNPTREGMYTAIVETLRERGIAYGVDNRWTWLS